MCWSQHGGSGLNITWAEAQDLELDDLRWAVERITTQREREAKALEKAAKQKR